MPKALLAVESRQAVRNWHGRAAAHFRALRWRQSELPTDREDGQKAAPKGKDVKKEVRTHRDDFSIEFRFR